MPRTAAKPKPYPAAIKALLADKSRVLSQARAMSQMGLVETARALWLDAAAREEEIAPQLELLARDREAAAHRVSAASCYQQAGDFGRALNLYRAALAGPLSDDHRRDLEPRIAECLSGLRRRGPRVGGKKLATR